MQLHLEPCHQKEKEINSEEGLPSLSSSCFVVLSSSLSPNCGCTKKFIAENFEDVLDLHNVPAGFFNESNGTSG